MTKLNRRDFLGLAAVGAAGAALDIEIFGQNRRRAAFNPEEATVSEMAAALGRGQITSEALTAFYIARIRSIDPKINSIIEINPQALEIARIRDRERLNRRAKGPLHGIPVVIKDNIDTADRMKTTAGSLALIDAPTPKRDAFIAERLREAGAVLLGKTNLSEWANFRDNDSISGWSGRGGQTHNPYVLDRNPCGSSSGTGAAISANLAAVGIGTETDGSIVCPSSICGLVGLKPTIGLVSRSGIIPIAESQDTAGPMTRSVADAAIVLTAIAGQDQNDPAMKGIKREAVDYTSFLKKDALRGARIGVARDYWGRRAEVDTIMDAALAVMKRAGAELIDIKFPNLRRFGDAEFTVLQYEFKDGLERYLSERGAKYRTLEDLIKFNKDNAERELKYFGQSIFESSAKKGSLRDKEYLEAREICRRYAQKEGIDEAVEKNNLDAIVAPSNAPAWLIDTINGDCGSGYVSSSSMPAVAGYPNITVPAGFYRELPIGISFFGKAFTEGRLIGIAYAFEQATTARRRPGFLPTYK